MQSFVDLPMKLILAIKNRYQKVIHARVEQKEEAKGQVPKAYVKREARWGGGEGRGKAREKEKLAYAASGCILQSSCCVSRANFLVIGKANVRGLFSITTGRDSFYKER
eukprot:TRINITY_DN6763_c0_g1_i1.p1 TRINITY_DN6763_c0_g1~~TRINITY_DN6763_c0_g1_i1.p1  ORF type:complete len:109 (-),score=15.69 TRINITY_DN6763_c0_g1_i1:786-1112(-)